MSSPREEAILLFFNEAFKCFQTSKLTSITDLYNSLLIEKILLEM